jgi:GST-like protein
MTKTYTPPNVWKWEGQKQGRFTSTNRPIAGATHDKELPVGKHLLQLYSLGTPNGVKVTVLLEELLAKGHAGAEYDAWLIRIGDGDQFGGGFGHFYAYAEEKQQYPIDRYTMETKRQLDVLDRRLADNRYMCGDEYTIADMAIWPWYGGLVIFNQYGAEEFLDARSYTNVLRWAEEIHAREPVKRGRMVNRLRGEPHEQLRERHDAGDFETKTQDKVEAAD